MGGHVFATDGLQTPRISSELYNQLKKEYANALAPLYRRTAYAEVLPDKPDHGDIDILVEGPHASTTPGRVAEALRADRFKCNGSVTNYAVPHPTIPGVHVQLDVQTSPDGYLEWQTFQNSYGDLSQIIGVINRLLGLTATDRGLYVRIPEIEPTNKKSSMIHLTHDPLAVLSFLGLNTARYSDRGFTGEGDVFAWVAAARFFNRYAVVPRDHEKRPENENHNDRARRAKRGMYRRFVDDWVPANPEAGANCAWTRELVLEEALKTFDKQVEYDARLAEHKELWREDALWRAIKEKVPRKGDSLALVIRGLKRWVSSEGGELVLHAEPLPQEKKVWVEGLEEGGEEKVLKWVEEHWMEVQVKEKAWATVKKAQGSASSAVTVQEEKEVKKTRLDH